MVFSSLVFMFAYLPITLLAYYLVPRQGRNIFLFIVNLIFYGWGEPRLVLLMVFNIFFNYIGGWLVDKYRADAKKKKLFLILTCVLDIGILAVFKYTGMITETLNMLPFLNIPELQISLPIGISFYTFQTMSYVIVGLAKKVIIANTMGTLTTNIFATTDENGVVGTWVGMIAYTFQIYFDFSGYSDMACGLGNMMGFEFLKNFNYPYIAKSITDFWRRWHISLSTWFKEYVYIPLGGNRRGLAIQLRNIAIVWALTGIWHGASWNFLLWGVYFGILLMLEKLFLLRWLERLPAILRHGYALFLILIGWVLFAFDDLSAGIAYLGALFGA